MILKKVTPMFNAIITTARKYTVDEVQKSGSIITKDVGSLKEYQKVIAVGTTVRGIKEGDLVLINPTRYGVRKHQEGSLKDGVISDNPITKYNFNVVTIDGIDCLKIYDQDIDLIVNEWEEEKPKSNLIITEPSIIV